MKDATPRPLFQIDEYIVSLHYAVSDFIDPHIILLQTCDKKPPYNFTCSLTPTAK